MKLAANLNRVIWDSDLLATRMTLAIGEICWAVMLLWIGDTFDRPTYHHMAELANEELWGAVFLFSAVTQITIVLTNDLHSRFAKYFSGWNAMLWCFTVWSMMASVYPPPAAIGGEIALACAALWIWIRPYILAEGYRRAGY